MLEKFLVADSQKVKRNYSGFSSLILGGLCRAKDVHGSRLKIPRVC